MLKIVTSLLSILAIVLICLTTQLRAAPSSGLTSPGSPAVGYGFNEPITTIEISPVVGAQCAVTCSCTGCNRCGGSCQGCSVGQCIQLGQQCCEGIRNSCLCN